MQSSGKRIDRRKKISCNKKEIATMWQQNKM